MARQHLSRVEGAKQAVDQIFQAIQFRSVVNLKGDLPEGYTDGGAKTVHGVGKVNAGNLTGAAFDAETSAALRALAEDQAAIWGAIAATDDPQRKRILLERYGARLVESSNRYATLMNRLGLAGPYG